MTVSYAVGALTHGFIFVRADISSAETVKYPYVPTVYDANMITSTRITSVPRHIYVSEYTLYRKIVL